MDVQPVSPSPRGKAAKNPARVGTTASLRKTGPSWRVEVTLNACRWAQNILVDVQGNHGGHLPAAARECIHAAVAALAEVPHAMEKKGKPT